MPLTAQDFDRVVRKLDMRERDKKHRLVWFEHEGKQVAWTERSHTRGDLGRVEFAIRRQLHVNGAQLKSLADCPMTRDEYVEHLKTKGVIGSAS